VLQTILLPLCFAEQGSLVTVSGGTHVPWSPSFHYLRSIVAPLLSRLGMRAECSIASWAGIHWQRQVSAQITPVRELRPITVIDRGGLVRVVGISAVSNLPDHIAARQRDRALALLSKHGIDASIEVLSAPSPGRLVPIPRRGVRAPLCRFGSLGAIGKRAEEVADEACDELLSYLRTRVRWTRIWLTNSCPGSPSARARPSSPPAASPGICSRTSGW